MSNPALRPAPLFSAALRIVRAEPLSVCLYLLLAGAMLVAVSGGLAPGLMPLAFAISFLLTWLLSVPVIHLLASGCFSLDGGEKLSPAEVWRGSLRSLPLALWAGFLASLMVMLGALALLVGAFFGWALGLWVLVVSVLENRKGRSGADRAAQLSGFSGIIWAAAATALGIFLSSYLVLLAQQVLGNTALVLYPPLSALFAMPLVVAAVIYRRG